MKRVLVCAAVLFVSSCGDSDDGSWKPYDQRSYIAGYEAGMIGTCNRIHRYKESVGKALIEEKIVRSSGNSVTCNEPERKKRR